MLVIQLMELEVRKEGNVSVPVHSVESDSYTFLATDVMSSLRNATDGVSALTLLCTPLSFSIDCNSRFSLSLSFQADVVYNNDLLIAVKILREVLLREKAGKSFDLSNTQDRYFMENMLHVTSRILGR